MRLFLTVFVCLLTTGLGVESSPCKFRGILSAKKKTCKNKNKEFKVLQVPNSLICGSICASNVKCESFVFFPLSLRCDGCKITNLESSDMVNAGEETSHFIKEKISRNVGCYSTKCGEKDCPYETMTGVANNSVESCISTCGFLTDSYTTIALQGADCYCNIIYLSALPGNCSTPCKGNKDQTCGGADSFMVFEVE